jgi:hypothetical protein
LQSQNKGKKRVAADLYQTASRRTHILLDARSELLVGPAAYRKVRLPTAMLHGKPSRTLPFDGKLSKESLGEVAERLKAAVC